MNARWMTALGALALTACTPPFNDEQAGVAAQVPTCDTDLTAQLDPVGAPGLAAAIIKDGALVCTAVAGHANIEEDRPVTPDTVFAWASVSKTVTSVAAMSLVDEGKIGLDEDIDRYLSFSVRNPSCPGNPITVRRLLTHTSSIIDNWDIYDPTYTIGDSPIALRDFVEGYLVSGGAYYDQDNNFDGACPGAVNDYSNIAIALLALVIEEVAQMSFNDFCKQRIFDPLGMNETSFVLADLNLDNVAMPYDKSTSASFVAHGHIGYPTIADGLLRTSVPQLARFVAMFAQLGEYGGKRILAADTAQEMRRIQFPELDDTQGLVWYYDTYGARDLLLGHDGEDPGTSAYMFFDPERGDGALLVANGSWYDANDDAFAADALLGALFDEASDH